MSNYSFKYQSTDVSSVTEILKKSHSLWYNSLKLSSVYAVFQGLLCGGGATEEAERREVPESLGGA